MKKYELLKEDTQRHIGTTLYRVRYLIDFAENKAGDLGGYITKEDNLSQGGSARVRDNARVLSNAKVRGNTIVLGNSTVSGNSIVEGAALVGGSSIVTDYAVVTDYALVNGNATVSGNARVAGGVLVTGNAQIFADSICEKLDPINIVGLTYNVTITDNNVHIGCKTFKLEQALKLASRWKATKLNYEEAEEIEAEKKIIVEAIKFRLWQLKQLSKEEGE